MKNIEKHKKFQDLVYMLEKNPEARNKNDCFEIAKLLDQTAFIQKRTEDVTVQKDIALNDVDKHQLYKRATYKKVPKGEFVYRRGQDGDSMYFIIKGKVAAMIGDDSQN